MKAPNGTVGAFERWWIDLRARLSDADHRGRLVTLAERGMLDRRVSQVTVGEAIFWTRLLGEEKR